MSSLSKMPCNWRSSENTHAHGRAGMRGGAARCVAWSGWVCKHERAGWGAGQPALRVPLRPLGVRLRPCVSPAHTGVSLLRRAGHGLKIAAPRSSGRAEAAEATATAGESWPRGRGRLRSASGTETPAAQRATATWRLSRHHCSLPGSAAVSAASKMCPGNWLWASMTFMARFSRSSSRSPVRTRGALEEMPAVQHPFLNVFELERLLYTGKTACNHADEVWPGLYLGDQDIANNHRELRRLGITHVLNASHSRWRGTHEAYEGLGIRYLGVEAHDSPAFDMSIHFQTAADFIHRALSLPGGKILVHCAVGVSRSATLVLAYLMLYHHLTLVEAIKKVKDHRGIIPNRGFLRQLLALDRRLRQGLEA